MKKLHVIALLLCFFLELPAVKAQYSGSFYIQGDLGKYYPVVFSDANWNYNKATEFEIGRSNIHTDANWRGSLIARFRVHTTNWGHGSNFIDANIRQSAYFIAGWQDATIANGNQVVVIWLQGGGNTYYYNSQANINPVVYDGVQNALPYQETNGPAVTYITSVDNYVNSNGTNSGGTANYIGPGTNYFAGNVGVGTTNSGSYKLAVNGGIHSQSVNVDLTGWSDYVFKQGYILPSLTEVKTYIDQNHHLPDMPSEQEVIKEGINLGEMNKLLTKKVEELTLYLIDKDSKINSLEKTVGSQQLQIDALQNQLNNVLKIIKSKN